MTIAVNNVVDTLDLLDRDLREEYKGRFGIHIVNIRGDIIHFSMSDSKLRRIESGYAYNSKLNYRTNIENVLNNFIQKELEG